MGRVTIAPENKVGGGEDRFPRLKLKNNERKRIWCPPELGSAMHEPWREWVHQIKAPKIVNGQAKKETATRNDGSTYDRYETVFVASPLCLGDLGVLAQLGVDEKNCPGCEMAKKTGLAVFKPVVRYAAPIVVYATKQGGWEIAAPFSATILIWSYPASRYSKLCDIAVAESRDLSEYDLRLGPCEPPEDFQKYEIAALGSRPPAWKTSDATAAYIKELWTTEGNRPTDDDLVAACGRPTQAEYMMEDLRRVEQLWNMAEHASAATTGADLSQPGNLTEGLGALLGGLGNNPQAQQQAQQLLAAAAAQQAAQPAAQVTAAVPGQAAAADITDLLGGGNGQPAAAPDAVQQVQEAKAQAQQDMAGVLNPDPLAAVAPDASLDPAPEGNSAGGTYDFNALLEGL